MNNFSSVNQWLLSGPAWIQYRVVSDFSTGPADPALLSSTRSALLQDPVVQAIIAEVSSAPAPALTNHKAAGHPLHKMVFLADLGLTIADPGIEPIACQFTGYNAPQIFTQCAPGVFTNTAPRLFTKSAPVIFGPNAPPSEGHRLSFR